MPLRLIEDSQELWHIKYAIQQHEISLLLGINSRLELYKVWQIDDTNFYQVDLTVQQQMILRGLMFFQGEGCQIWLDTPSTMSLVHHFIQAALREYNSTSDWRYRGM